MPGGLCFAGLLFLASHAWIVVAREVPTSWSLLSYVLQQACVWAAYAVTDAQLSRRPARFALAALGTLYVAFTSLDGLLLRITSLPLREILPMLLASQHMIAGMQEIGLSPLRILVLLVLLLAAALCGGSVRLSLGDIFTGQPLSRTNPRTALSMAVALPLLFSIEQVRSRDDADYLYRALRMPRVLSDLHHELRLRRVPARRARGAHHPREVAT